MNGHRKLSAVSIQLIFAIVLGRLAFFPIACGGPITQPSPSKFTRTPTVTLTAVVALTSTATPTITNRSTETGTSTPLVTNTPTITFTRTATYSITQVATALAAAPDLNLSAGVTTLDRGLYFFNCVNIGAGGVVTINGAVTIFVKCFNLASGATIIGRGNEFQLHPYGPGSGNPAAMYTVSGGVTTGGISFGSGGGHGGAGGTYCPGTGCVPVGGSVTNCYSGCAIGGVAYDDPILPTLTGSNGFNNSHASGQLVSPDCSSGGSLLKLVVYDPILDTLSPATLDGVIDMSGHSGCGVYFYHDGGGSGGTLLIEASSVVGSGTLRADGGGGDSTSGGAGGGGGGGIISVIGDKTSFLGTLSVAAGPGGSPAAQAGIVNSTAAPSSGFY